MFPHEKRKTKQDAAFGLGVYGTAGEERCDRSRRGGAKGTLVVVVAARVSVLQTVVVGHLVVLIVVGHAVVLIDDLIEVVAFKVCDGEELKERLEEGGRLEEATSRTQFGIDVLKEKVNVAREDAHDVVLDREAPEKDAEAQKHVRQIRGGEREDAEDVDACVRVSSSPDVNGHHCQRGSEKEFVKGHVIHVERKVDSLSSIVCQFIFSLL